MSATITSGTCVVAQTGLEPGGFLSFFMRLNHHTNPDFLRACVSEHLKQAEPYRLNFCQLGSSGQKHEKATEAMRFKSP